MGNTFFRRARVQVRNRSRQRSGVLGTVALLVVTAIAMAPTPEASAATTRDVLLVGNSVGGTVSILDGRTFANLGHVNVIPDLQQRLAVINSNPVTAVGYAVATDHQKLKHFEPAGGIRYVDDVFLSPDGTKLFVSRSNLADVVAFDMTKSTHPMLWEFIVSGFHADHATLSPDGSKIVVSATTQDVAQVIDANTGKQVAQFATGHYPHQNDYSANGKHIYNGSIGDVGLPSLLNGFKGTRQLEVVDAVTFKVIKTYPFTYGVRPTVITPDEKTAYMQLSYLNGLIKFDLTTGQTVQTLNEPMSSFAKANFPSKDDYYHDSAHHGLALSGDGTKLCDAGTIDNTVSVVSLGLVMSVQKTINVGMIPYWATTSVDGNFCFVSLSGANQVVVINYATGAQVATVPVGSFPQRNRLAKIPDAELRLLTPGNG
jgi:YVTN family beta-propeller protein